MDGTEALLAARRHIDDALDALDTFESHTPATVMCAILLHLARIAVNVPLADDESKGDETNPRA